MKTLHTCTHVVRQHMHVLKWRFMHPYVYRHTCHRHHQHVHKCTRPEAGFHHHIFPTSLEGGGGLHRLLPLFLSTSWCILKTFKSPVMGAHRQSMRSLSTMEKSHTRREGEQFRVCDLKVNTGSLAQLWPSISSVFWMRLMFTFNAWLKSCW